MASPQPTATKKAVPLPPPKPTGGAARPPPPKPGGGSPVPPLIVPHGEGAPLSPIPHSVSTPTLIRPLGTPTSAPSTPTQLASEPKIQLSAEDSAKRVFKLLDVNNDGTISIQDLISVLQDSDQSPTRLELITTLQRYHLPAPVVRTHARRQSAGFTPPPVAARNRGPDPTASPNGSPATAGMTRSASKESAKDEAPAPAPTPAAPAPAPAEPAAEPTTPLAKSTSKTVVPGLSDDVANWLDEVEAEKSPRSDDEKPDATASKQPTKGGMYKDVDWEKLTTQAKAQKGDRESSSDDEEVFGPRSPREGDDDTGDSIADKKGDKNSKSLGGKIGEIAGLAKSKSRKLVRQLSGKIKDSKLVHKRATSDKVNDKPS